MATISNTPRPGYVWDSTDNVWYPIGTGPHTHADYITSGSAINPNIVDAKGDIIAATAADTVARLAVGSNDQVLTADSSTATGLKWATPAAGGMTLIQETVASTNSSISFTSIPGTYKQLLLVWSGVYHSGQTSSFDLRLNNNSGGSAYSWHGNKFAPSANVTAGTSSVLADYMFGYRCDYSTNLIYSSKGWLTIDNYASTTKLKTLTSRYDFADNNAGINYVYNINGVFNSTSAITSVDIVRTSGTDTLTNIANTSIRLYGLS
jgi:hypothetical protein